MRKQLPGVFAALVWFGCLSPVGVVGKNNDAGTSDASSAACQSDSDCTSGNPDVCNICTAPNNYLVCRSGACECACQVPDAGPADAGSCAYRDPLPCKSNTDCAANGGTCDSSLGYCVCGPCAAGSCIAGFNCVANGGCGEPAGTICVNGTFTSSCGNGVCDCGETATTCPADCANCPPTCNLTTYTPTCSNGVFTTCIASDPPCGGGRVISSTCPFGCDPTQPQCATQPPDSGTCSPGGLAMSPMPVDFGTVAVGSTSTAVVTMTNADCATISVTGITIQSGSGPFSISSSPPLPLSLPVGGSFQITLTFAPTSAGSNSDVLLLTWVIGTGTPMTASDQLIGATQTGTGCQYNSDCATGLTCTAEGANGQLVADGGSCVICQAVFCCPSTGQACPTGRECCTGYATCVSGTCQACGYPGQPCCSNGACSAGNVCDSTGTCQVSSTCQVDAGSCQPNSCACTSNADCCSGNCILRSFPGYCCVAGGCP